ncbi:TPA: restriction endonuclease subunit S [Escherichia coli]|uniref:restriction endonuclease subunit S n=1 Tax=Escherichia coli TaxID=562 RepID=UPI000D0B19B1|nr:restriction endonuclease subunit S [Escherichia coli]EGK4627029.1 restriction endonuclease subunit S [Escherichia coli]EGK4669548.1 restriction endonuclease subunit S [Escherichia coli]EHK6188132.1 restriction endonuclease subunit S [Escherichia coli]UUP95856.1 restriction endonuclease subunit S [Escherichia coli]HBD1044558.1 restriction endonuclease subunit S [Escherichia coli]
MSELSYLEKLLDGVEVEWKPLKDVCDFKNGFAFKSSLFKETGLPIVRITNIDGFNVDLDEVKYFSLNDYKEDLSSFEVSMGNILIAMSGATTGKVGIYKKGTKCYLNQRVGKFIPKENILNNNYLYHFLLLNTETIYILAGGGAQPNLSSNALMSKLLIPIPCPDNPEKSLAIQSEIVRILDKFTALTAELTAELNMRKKQYNYYRDQLLRFKEGEVEWKTLGEIGDFTYGYAAKAMDSGDARFVRITDINKDGKLSKENPMYVELNEENEKYTLDKNDLLMARTGATFGKTMIFEEDYPAVYAGFLIKLNLNKTIINAKYYWHFAQSDFFWEQANKLVSGGGQPQFNANALKQVRVPIPYPSHPQKSLDEQGRIVDILDKFDAIAASITEGLPREIELRQKQYEYYRDLLLSFPKPETVSK